jgi:hypothetical protein
MVEEQQRLRRIRALLAKAEATDYPSEAESFLAKVAELVARWGVDEALVWAATDAQDRPAPVDATIVVDAPYAARKAVLVHEVATAMGCRAVRLDQRGSAQRITVIGFANDVRRTEVLVTSLLVQMTSDMVRSTPTTGDASNTASFRRSFIISFANTVADRLTTSRTRAVRETNAAADRTTSTALVLADRERAVDDAVAARFGRLRTSYVSSGSSSAGRDAGRVSAERADLGTDRLNGARARLGA